MPEGPAEEVAGLEWAWALVGPPKPGKDALLVGERPAEEVRRW